MAAGRAAEQPDHVGGDAFEDAQAVLVEQGRAGGAGERRLTGERDVLRAAVRVAPGDAAVVGEGERAGCDRAAERGDQRLVEADDLALAREHGRTAGGERDVVEVVVAPRPRDADRGPVEQPDAVVGEEGHARTGALDRVEVPGVLVADRRGSQDARRGVRRQARGEPVAVAFEHFEQARALVLEQGRAGRARDRFARERDGARPPVRAPSQPAGGECERASRVAAAGRRQDQLVLSGCEVAHPHARVLAERRDDPDAAVRGDDHVEHVVAHAAGEVGRCGRALAVEPADAACSSPPPSPENSPTNDLATAATEHGEAPVRARARVQPHRPPRGLPAREPRVSGAEHAHARLLVDRLSVAAGPRLRRGRQQTEKREGERARDGSLSDRNRNARSRKSDDYPDRTATAQAPREPRAKTMPSTRPWASTTGAPESPGSTARRARARVASAPAMDRRDAPPHPRGERDRAPVASTCTAAVAARRVRSGRRASAGHRELGEIEPPVHAHDPRRPAIDPHGPRAVEHVRDGQHAPSPMGTPVAMPSPDTVTRSGFGRRGRRRTPAGDRDATQDERTADELIAAAPVVERTTSVGSCTRVTRSLRPVGAFEQQRERLDAHLAARLVDRRQLDVGEAGDERVVVADHRHVLGDPHAVLFQAVDQAHRDEVVRGDDRGRQRARSRSSRAGGVDARRLVELAREHARDARQAGVVHRAAGSRPDGARRPRRHRRRRGRSARARARRGARPPGARRPTRRPARSPAPASARGGRSRRTAARPRRPRSAGPEACGDTRISPSVRYSSSASSIACSRCLRRPPVMISSRCPSSEACVLDAVRDLGEERVVEIVEQDARRCSSGARRGCARSRSADSRAGPPPSRTRPRRSSLTLGLPRMTRDTSAREPRLRAQRRPWSRNRLASCARSMLVRAL